MIKNGDLVEAHQVSLRSGFKYIEALYLIIVLSGTTLIKHGKRSAMLSMLSVPVASNYTKGRNTTMCLTLIFKMGCLPSSFPTMFQVCPLQQCAPFVAQSSCVENPYNVAQTFLQSNDLPLTYIDEVVKFIEKGTSGVNIGSAGEDYVDPFTGMPNFYRSELTTTIV